MTYREFWAALLLLVTGSILFIPALYQGIITIAGGHWPVTILGGISILLGVLLFVRR